MGPWYGFYSAGLHASSTVSFASPFFFQRSDVSFFPETQSHAFTHLSFALSVGLCAYNFFRSIMLDPGTCPKPANDAELKAVSIP